MRELTTAMTHWRRAIRGAVPSNFAVSRYSEFGSGFNIEYVEEQERIEPVYAKYVSNIIGVEPENNKIIVEESYQEYGQKNWCNVLIMKIL